MIIEILAAPVEFFPFALEHQLLVCSVIIGLNVLMFWRVS